VVGSGRSASPVEQASQSLARTLELLLDPSERISDRETQRKLSPGWLPQPSGFAFNLVRVSCSFRAPFEVASA